MQVYNIKKEVSYLNFDPNIIDGMMHSYCSLVNKTHSGYMSRCPFCGGSTKHSHRLSFALNYLPNENIWLYGCWRAGCLVKGNIYGLYMHLSSCNFKTAKNALETQNTIILKRKQPVVKKGNINDTFLKEDCLCIDSVDLGIIQKKYYRKLIHFLIDRKLIGNEIYIAYKGKYKNRIILPVFEKGKLVYFQARALSNDVEPKYKNPFVDKKGILPYAESFQSGGLIVITEGLIDAMSFEGAATSCLGASISKEFIKKLLKFKPSKIVIVLDNDAPGKNSLIKTINRLVFIDDIVYYYTMPDEHKHIKDLNELKIKANKKITENFILNNIKTGFEIKKEILYG